jgi:hypothetical protein
MELSSSPIRCRRSIRRKYKPFDARKLPRRPLSNYIQRERWGILVWFLRSIWRAFLKIGEKDSFITKILKYVH